MNHFHNLTRYIVVIILLDIHYYYYLQERSDILTSLKRKAKIISEGLDKIEGIKCNAIQGGMYAFPRILLPPEAIAKAKVATVWLY